MSLDLRALLAAAFIALPCFLACGSRIEIGQSPGLGGSAGVAGSTSSGGSAGSEPGGSGGEAPCEVIACRGKIYACGDCQDNDGDGSADAADGACLGPCDDDEEGLGTGLRPSASETCRQDCYFDVDSGLGNDGCSWSHRCDPLSLAPDFWPSGDERCEYDPRSSMSVDCEEATAEQPPSCLESCLPLVPNGCDCFGCCELPAGSGEFRFLGASSSSGCELGALDDPARCPPCTPVPSCFNSCESCETCVGRPAPEECGESACAAGERRCGAGGACPPDSYCVTGCCVDVPR